MYLFIHLDITQLVVFMILKWWARPFLLQFIQEYYEVVKDYFPFHQDGIYVAGTILCKHFICKIYTIYSKCNCALGNRLSHLFFRDVKENITNIFVINCGSSSIKFQIIEPATARLRLSGIVERIGLPDSKFKYKYYENDSLIQKVERSIPFHGDSKNKLTDEYSFLQSLEEISNLVEEK